jgi:hypothetical protein
MEYPSSFSRTSAAHWQQAPLNPKVQHSTQRMEQSQYEGNDKGLQSSKAAEGSHTCFNQYTQSMKQKAMLIVSVHSVAEQGGITM